MISRVKRDSGPKTPREAWLNDVDKEMENPPRFGEEIMDEAVKEPTLNRWLDNSPKVGKPINYPELVETLQRKRALFITAEQKKKEPKIEGEEE